MIFLNVNPKHYRSRYFVAAACFALILQICNLQNFGLFLIFATLFMQGLRHQSGQIPIQNQK